MPGFGSRRSPGAACSCCVGLEAWCACTGHFGVRGRLSSCCAGWGNFRFLWGFGERTTEAAALACTAGLTSKSIATVRRIGFCSSTPKSYTAIPEAITAASKSPAAISECTAARCIGFCFSTAKSFTAVSKCPACGDFTFTTAAEAAATIPECTTARGTAEAAAARSALAGEAPTPRGVFGESTAMASGKAPASAGCAAGKTTALWAMEAGEPTRRSRFFVRLALPAGRHDMAGGLVCTGRH